MSGKSESQLTKVIETNVVRGEVQGFYPVVKDTIIKSGFKRKLEHTIIEVSSHGKLLRQEQSKPELEIRPVKSKSQHKSDKIDNIEQVQEGNKISRSTHYL